MTVARIYDYVYTAGKNGYVKSAYTTINVQYIDAEVTVLMSLYSNAIKYNSYFVPCNKTQSMAGIATLLD